MASRHSVPRPEVIDGGDWTVRRSHTPRVAHVTADEAVGGTMTVPLDLVEAQRAVRLHELTHVHITPRDRMGEEMHNGRRPDVLNLAEDARVHRYMRANGFDIAPIGDIITDEEIASLVEHGSDLDLAAFAVAVEGTSAADLLRPMAGARRGIIDSAVRLAEHSLGEMSEYRRGMYRERADWAATLDLHDALVQTFDGGDEEETATGRSTPGRGDGTVPPPEVHRLAAGDGGEWVPAAVYELPHRIPMPARMRGVNRPRPSQRGRRLKRVGRLASDGNVFSDRPPTKGGGAVLLDLSGSMHLTGDDVLALMRAFPAGVIAGYSTVTLAAALHAGLDVDPELCAAVVVIARNGRRCTDDLLELATGGSNGCDLFALQWLAQQRGPRYWVSDALVNGMGSGTVGMLRDCLAVQHACRARRVLDVDSILRREAT